MSEALKTIGKVAGVVAAVTRFIPGGQVISAIATGVAVVASVGAALTATKPPLLGSSTDITIGADQQTPMMIGDVYCGGARVHQVGYGPTLDKVPNPYLACVDVYSAGGPIAGYDQYLADFEPITFDGQGYATGYFNDLLSKQSSVGPLLQTTALGGRYGAIPQWGADAKLSGKAHVVWSARWSQKGKFQSGFPQTGIRGRGVLTWDPRADSTYPGGSGAQRWADPSDRAAFDAARATWAYSFRAGLHGLRYALGTWERDLNNPASVYVLTYGIGLKLDQIVVEDFVALENLCEANGWEVSGVLREPDDKWANLKRILETGGAEPCWKGGRLGLKLTAPRVALDTITRADIADGDIRAQGAVGWRDAINAVIPKYRSPDHKWELQESTKIVVPALVAQDGEEKLEEIPFEFVKVAKQAAQLAAYRLYDRREFGPVDIPMLPRLRGYDGGDRLSLAEDIWGPLGLPHGEIVVISRSFNPATMTGTLTVMGETMSKHALALAQTGVAPPPIVIPGASAYDAAAGSLFPRGAYRYLSKTPTFPASSDDTSISIAALTQGTLDDGTTLLLPAGKRAGLTPGQYWGVFWDLQGSTSAQTATHDLTAGTLPASVTVARASTGTYVTNAGALATAAAGVARFDYAATSPFALRGLLVEPAATNLVLYSQDLTQAAWVKTAATATATRLVEASGSGTHQAAQTQSYTTGKAYTHSVDAKLAVGTRYLVIVFPAAAFGTALTAKFDLTGAGSVNAAATSSGVTATITPAPGGGFRCVATATATATASGAWALRLHNAAGAGTTAYTGDGTSALDLTNAQVEEGTSATSRMPTTTATFTRAADVVTLDWGAKGVPDGAITATVTFDDGSTQALAMTVASGKAVLPTPLNRSRVRSVSASYTDQPYVVVPDAQVSAYMAQSRYVFVQRQATLLNGTEPTDTTPPPGYGGGGGGGGMTSV